MTPHPAPPRHRSQMQNGSGHRSEFIAGSDEGIRLPSEGISLDPHRRENRAHGGQLDSNVDTRHGRCHHRPGRIVRLAPNALRGVSGWGSQCPPTPSGVDLGTPGHRMPLLSATITDRARHHLAWSPSAFPSLTFPPVRSGCDGFGPRGHHRGGSRLRRHWHRLHRLVGLLRCWCRWSRLPRGLHHPVGLGIRRPRLLDDEHELVFRQAQLPREFDRSSHALYTPLLPSPSLGYGNG